uniref:Uncharacterized protein n=1 Tax=Rhizophora mucronata TaxID=61149 RepID=A0A2P2QDW0_RHIMU
MPKSERRF